MMVDPFYRLMGSADREQCKIMGQLCLSRCICIFGSEGFFFFFRIGYTNTVSCKLSFACPNSFCVSAQLWSRENQTDNGRILRSMYNRMYIRWSDNVGQRSVFLYGRL